jgi:magnesium transporter
MGGAEWIDLLDPTVEELRERVPLELYPGALEQLAAPTEPGREPRPQVRGGDGFVVAVLLAPVVVEAEDRIFYQELDLVLTRDLVVSVRKTPEGGAPLDYEEVRPGPPSASPAVVAYRLIDLIAERYLDIDDSLNEEVDELEDHMDEWRPDRTRRRLTDLRHDMLHIRRMLGPTRDAVRRLVDGRIDTGPEPVVDEQLRPAFVEAYDKLLRASEALDFARDLVAAAREYHQARIAEEQNDVVKKLTVIASLLLFPTFVVGVYGQNFGNMPELGWKLGYAFSWAVIVLSTLAQLAFFRWRRWI